MIRLFTRVVLSDCRGYGGMCSLLSKGCSMHQPRSLSSSVLCSTRNASSSATPPVVKEDIMVSEIPMTSTLILILETVHPLGFSENEMKTLWKKQPKLMKSSPAHWSNVDSLLGLGFKKDEVLLVLERWPQVLSLNKRNLADTFLAWNNSGFGEDLLYSLLTTHPSFLQVNHNHVSKRIKQYQLYFESKKRVGKLLLIAPKVLEENLTILFDKLNYLDELCTDKKDVVSSGVLVHSVLHIKARHEFLIRAGIYKRPTKDFHKSLSLNPRLERIVNTTDQEFICSVARLSMFEYTVFLEMFEEELAESDYDMDSDSDEESNKLSYHQIKKKKL